MLTYTPMHNRGGDGVKVTKESFEIIIYLRNYRTNSVDFFQNYVGTRYSLVRHSSEQWRRFVVKSWGGVEVRAVRSSHKTVSDYTLRQRFPTIQQSRFLAAYRRLEKLVLPSSFDTIPVILGDVKFAELINNIVLNERM